MKTRNLTRLVAVPVTVAGILGGALGMAAVANASTHAAHLPTMQSGAHDNTQGATHPAPMTVDPHMTAKITNAVETRT